ncbi:YbaB/EbfC family nucleoid-associated protein [Mycobacterium spongiae]|uniref:Uncharacterized protein n=1 Tax=Mycobacterium spongiae TaxID=886343 RepID=A0A975JXI2_9MYCO|nr:YbaB/EbfC family nucleoid-associated protein [Mycobacterium spongiae]QUR67536.1 hypothetical protein F6B93_10910 [Mycobacterium spongiae]
MESKAGLNGLSTESAADEELTEKVELARSVINNTHQKLLGVREQLSARTATMDFHSNLELTKNLLESLRTSIGSWHNTVAQSVFTSKSDEDLVQISVTGGGEVRSVKLAREIVNPDDIATLEDFIALVIADLFQQIHYFAKNHLEYRDL